MTGELTELQKKYLFCLGQQYAPGDEDDDEDVDKDSLWEQMSSEEKAATNEIVKAAFGPWL